MELDAVREHAWRRELLRDPAEMGERLVGDDHGDGDRDQRLAKLLPLIPAEKELLHHEPDDADCERCDDERDDPVAHASLRASEGGRGLSARQTLLQVEREESGQHVKRAVSHVDDAHQPEDEREAARDDEIEPGESEAVQADDDEDAHVLGGLVGNPGDARRRVLRRRAPAGPAFRAEPRTAAAGARGRYRDSPLKCSVRT